MSTSHPPIQRSVHDVRAVLHKLLAPCIACVQLDRSEARQLRAQVSTSRLANARRSSDHDSAEDVHAVLARLLEIRLEATLPAAQPRLQPLDVGLVATNLFERLRGVAVCPKLVDRRRLRSTTWFGSVTGKTG